MKTQSKSTQHPQATRTPEYRIINTIWFLAVLSITSTTALSQTPSTINLKPVYVGGSGYQLSLSGLLPDGAAHTNWFIPALPPMAADGRHRAADGTAIEQPPSVTLQQVRLVGGGGDDMLVVAPHAGDARSAPYVFEVQGQDIHGNTVTIRFRLQIKPFGVDERKLSALNPVETYTPAIDAVGGSPAILSTSTSDEETISLSERLKDAPWPTFAADYSDENISVLNKLIDLTVGTEKTVTEGIDRRLKFQADDYLMVHVIVWKNVEKADQKGEAKRELWALFKANDDTDTNIKWEPLRDRTNRDVFRSRIFGSKRVALLLVHLNTPEPWDVKYRVLVNQRIPTPLQDVMTLVGNITNRKFSDPLPTKDIWGARMMLIRYAASDLVVKVNTVTANTTQIEQAKDYSKTYLNEGKYHWDISIGLPVKSVRELQYKTDANNKVTAAAKERQDVYGFLNIFPKKVDLADENFLTAPHFVFGVPLASKPLQHPFAGLGYGIYQTPIKFNVFAGIVFNRERVPRTLKTGDAATSSQLENDLRTRWVRKFMFGVNFPVGQIKDAIKNK